MCPIFKCGPASQDGELILYVTDVSNRTKGCQRKLPQGPPIPFENISPSHPAQDIHPSNIYYLIRSKCTLPCYAGPAHCSASSCIPPVIRGGVESKNTESDEMREVGGGMVRPKTMQNQVCEITRVGATATQRPKIEGKKECDGTVSFQVS
ncbi:hypothetical protein BC826DRAFT_1048849 [Russula brevipes]|nr:hypothetical protein BC826DRAFT_1048849 [Russula brevipes]